MADPVGGPFGPWSIVGNKILGRKNKPNPPIDVILKDRGVWNSPTELQKIERQGQRYVDSIEPTNALRASQKRIAENRLAKVRARLDDLEAAGQTPVDDYAGSENAPIGTIEEQQASPVFRGLNPYSIGAGGAILGIGGGGFDADNARRDAIVKKIMAAGRGRESKGPVRRRPPPKTNAQKIIGAAGKLLSKIPKGMLPDSELVGIAKSLGKAGRGAFGPALVSMGGEKLIKLASKFGKAANNARAVKILGPNDGYAILQRQKITKGPTTRGGLPYGSGANPVPRAAARAKIEPPRPRPPGPPGQTGKSGKPLRASKKAPPTIAQGQRSTATPGPSTPPKAPVGVPGSGGPGVPPRTPIAISLPQVLTAAASIFGGRPGRSSSPRMNLLPPSSPASSPASSSNYFSQLEPAQVGTGSGCYTVCRKKGGPKKKRKAARICVTPTAARKAGLIN